MAPAPVLQARGFPRGRPRGHHHVLACLHPFTLIKKGGKPATGTDKLLPHRPSKWLDGLPPLILRYTAVDLRVLDLSYCTKLTDEGIEGVLARAPSLHTLSLAGCTNLTDRSVENICKLGVQLGSVTDAAIVKLARACLGLKSVDAACRDTLFSVRAAPRPCPTRIPLKLATPLQPGQIPRPTLI